MQLLYYHYDDSKKKKHKRRRRLGPIYVSRLAANARCQASQLPMTAWMVGALLGHGGEAAMFVRIQSFLFFYH